MVLLGIFCSAVSISAQSAGVQNSTDDSKDLLKSLFYGNMSGVWQINNKESDNVMEKLQKRIQIASNSSSEANESSKTNADLPLISVSLLPPEFLELEVGKETAINENLQGVTQSRLLIADGVQRTIEMEPDVKISVRAIEKDGRLIVETISPRGNKMTETFNMNQDSNKLNVLIRVEDPKAGELLSLHRVYDRLETPLNDGVAAQ